MVNDEEGEAGANSFLPSADPTPALAPVPERHISKLSGVNSHISNTTLFLPLICNQTSQWLQERRSPRTCFGEVASHVSTAIDPSVNLSLSFIYDTASCKLTFL